ncbi:hydantoinase/oxoprolinase family protein [Sciscionella sediminilitoris]|uniref:hydantoinase/oxoprolinase family protein n=1 Tax=Sciscionella sediminilitoris TaxID=1445613 RepID=UPI00068A9D4F|nr:hydantoinase/oxoprolinase family protein [Sciscionella sp. SE31]
MNDLRIGIDVGGTNTDAVVVSPDGTVVDWHKTATTDDLFDGIDTALRKVLSTCGADAVRQVMLGTTHPVNAIIGRSGLARVGVLRVAAPATLSISPLASWPQDLADLVVGHVAIVRGGHEFQGDPLVDLDRDAIRRFALDCRDTVAAVAITGLNSPANPEHEQEALRIVTEVLGPDVPVTVGHEVGGLGLLERENSAVLNAALTRIGRTVVEGLEQSLARRGVGTDVYLTQNDGTLLAADEAVRRPVLTLGSGPTNSMRGAAFLSGLDDAIVMDVGGTSTDVGMLVGSFPRESAFAVEIGGVRTNYRMPDLLAVGLGGGSIVEPSEPVRVGPDSVGHRITTMARGFGGDVLTLTDVSAICGRTTVPQPDRCTDIDPATAASILAVSDERLRVLADRIKASRANLPLVAVGGGAHVVPDSIPGVTQVVRPPHGAVANAIGAAIAEASGTVDRTYRYDDSSRDDCLAQARRDAELEAVRAGADATAVRVTALTEVPLGYMPGRCARVQVKAVGPLLTVQDTPESAQQFA